MHCKASDASYDVKGLVASFKVLVYDICYVYMLYLFHISIYVYAVNISILQFQLLYIFNVFTFIYQYMYVYNFTYSIENPKIVCTTSVYILCIYFIYTIARSRSIFVCGICYVPKLYLYLNYIIFLTLWKLYILFLHRLRTCTSLLVCVWTISNLTFS